MSISVTQYNNIKCYNFSFGKTLPEFLELYQKNKKDMKKHEDFKKRVELIYDFTFKNSSQHLEISEDGNYIVASGLYKPMIKFFDVNNVSLKCERGIDSEIIKFRMLSPDYKKVAMICKDRNIELHAQYGRHFKIRTPRVARDLIYNPYSCDLLTAGTGEEIYRLNLEEGKFLPSLKSDSTGINSLGFSPNLNILLAGDEEGTLSIFDLRVKNM